jgi:AcrR family transcriptional regulator
MDTRARIVDAAIQLFNRRGVGATSTNHVAAQLGMSPGNLYYYFRNKDQIVRAAFDELAREWDEAFGGEPGAPDDLVRLVLATFAIFEHYKFFARELPALLHADAVLRRKYRALHQKTIQRLEELFAALAQAGALRVSRRVDLRNIAECCWIVAAFFIPHAELAGGKPDVAHGATLVLQVLQPHLADDAHQQLLAAVRRNRRAADRHRRPR